MVLLLVGFGARAIYQGVCHVGATGRTHSHTTRGTSTGARIGGGMLARPLLVGAVHGLAGSGALTALVVATLPSTVTRLSYLALFGVGSIWGWPPYRAWSAGRSHDWEPIAPSRGPSPSPSAACRPRSGCCGAIHSSIACSRRWTAPEPRCGRSVASVVRGARGSRPQKIKRVGRSNILTGPPQSFSPHFCVPHRSKTGAFRARRFRFHPRGEPCSVQ